MPAPANRPLDRRIQALELSGPTITAHELRKRHGTQLWTMIREPVRDGDTVLLTTQYPKEADALAEAVVIIDRDLAACSRGGGPPGAPGGSRSLRPSLSGNAHDAGAT